MDRFLFNKFVFEIEDKLYDDSCIMFAQMADNVVQNPKSEKVTFNYYPQESHNLQLVVGGSRINDTVSINDLRMHHSSDNVWKLKILTPINEDDGAYLATRPDGNGLVAIRLVNEQVLECIESGSVIEAQTVGFAFNVNIYRDENEYESRSPKSGGGLKYLMKDGFVAATTFIANNSLSLTDEERNSREHIFDTLVDVRGTVISCCKYPLKMYDMDMNNYYLAEIMTDFGKLTIIIARSLFPKDVNGFGEGNIIVGKVMLSGDVCIYEYDKYISSLSAATNE